MPRTYSADNLWNELLRTREVSSHVNTTFPNMSHKCASLLDNHEAAALSAKLVALVEHIANVRKRFIELRTRAESRTLDRSGRAHPGFSRWEAVGCYRHACCHSLGENKYQAGLVYSKEHIGNGCTCLTLNRSAIWDATHAEIVQSHLVLHIAARLLEVSRVPE